MDAARDAQNENKDILVLTDDSLLLILNKVVSAFPPSIRILLLVCKRFRRLLLGTAASIRVTPNNTTLLQHCCSVRTITLTGCSRLPWDTDDSSGAPRIAQSSLSHLSSLTRIDTFRGYWTTMRLSHGPEGNFTCLADAELAKLRCLPCLTHLDTGTGVTDSGLEVLTGLTSLRSLELSGCRSLTAAGGAQLSKLSFLHSLKLELSYSFFAPRRDRSLEQQDLAFLAAMTALRSLDLSLDDIGQLNVDAALSHGLSALASLESLTLRGRDQVTSQGLAFLSHLTRLSALFLAECPGPDYNDALMHIAGLTRLQCLEFNNRTWSNQGMACLLRLAALTHLNLWHCNSVSEARFEYLSSLSSLRELQLEEMPPHRLAAVVPHLIGLRHLGRVTLGHVPGGDDDSAAADSALALLCTLSTLTSIELSNSVTLQGLALLQKLTNLLRLDIGWSDSDSGSAVVMLAGLTILTQLKLSMHGLCDRGSIDENVAPLDALRNLQHLDLSCGELIGWGLGELTGLTRLTCLNFRFCNRLTDLTLAAHSKATLREIHLESCNSITDDSLAALQELRELQRFQISSFLRDDRSLVTDAGLAHLRDLTHLTYLNIQRCLLVTGKGLAQLPRLQALAELHVRVSSNPDKELKPLLTGFPSLKRLYIKHPPIQRWCIKRRPPFRLGPAYRLRTRFEVIYVEIIRWL